ncbi:beta-N-acetylhexosaminidase [Lacisediminihabitans sp.]|uniref:beta-N-acetylhexosaminidase n=1 Tax=Lacisediminihabitans sp. TaxID=2787631 RepID=UPI00374DCDAD
MTDRETSARNAAGVLLPGFAGTTLPEWLATRLEQGLAGVCLFAENIVSLDQVRRLTDQIRRANPLAIIAIDEEGGDVTRLFAATGSPYPGNAILGRIDDLDYTEAVARSVGWQLRRAGCSLDFAPDVDINSNPDNPVIGVRSFGTDPALVARHSAAWVRGLESTGVASSAKHFPGHGDTAQDSHVALPVVDLSLDELRERELVPFRAAIEAGTSTIMTSHIVLPRVDAHGPATFSRRILGDLLRGELGFAGVIVTDALDMAGASAEIGIAAAAVRAVDAGCDLLCIGTRNTAEQLDEIVQALLGAISAGGLSAARLEEAAARNRDLARAVDERSELIPVPEYGGELDDEFDLARTSGSFDLRPGVAVSAERALVVLETASNIAVGRSLWGVAAAGEDPIVLRRGDALELPSGVQPVLVGKGNHRHPWVREAIDAIRAGHPSALVVDMGWPGDDRAYADVATFGGSRHVGRALLAWLEARADAVGTETGRP